MLYLVKESFSDAGHASFRLAFPQPALQEPFAQDLVDTIKREATLRLFAEGRSVQAMLRRC